MNTLTTTPTTTTIEEFICANWSHDESARTFWLGELNYRNRLRWTNVMPAVTKAMPDLWEHRFGTDWATYTARFPYFELAQLENVFHAVMGGTRESSEYAVDQLFGQEAAHIARPMLSTMWKRYVV